METEAPGVIITFFAFIIGFSLLVFIHEWGHYRVGRLFGVKIETFSIGFGKELFGWTDKRGVRWKFCMLPLGGYVKFFGDRTAASDSIADAEYYSEDEKAVCFHFKPVWQRALIVFAGPAINLLAAIIVFAGFYYSGGIYYSEPVINDVVAESAAEEAGLTAGDRILAINSTNVDRFSDIMPLIRLYPGEQITVHIDRGGVLASIPVTLGTQYMEDRFGTRYPLGVLGVRSVPVQHKELGIGQSLVEGTVQTVSMVKSIFVTTGQLIMGVRSVKEVGGPVKIVSMTGEAAEQGLVSLIWFLALISVNLGVVNLLPIPVLDGGHLLYYFIEAVKGSPLSQKAQEAGLMAGFALMLFFMVVVTLNDLQSVAL